MKGLFKRVGDHLVPAGQSGREAVRGLSQRKPFICDVRGARNPDHHELFWVMCQLVADATDSTKEAVKAYLLLKAGLVDQVWLPDGKMLIQPRSIAFEKMDQAEFNSFFERAVEHAAELLQTKPREVMDRFNELLSPESRARFRRRKAA